MRCFKNYLIWNGNGKTSEDRRRIGILGRFRHRDGAIADVANRLFGLRLPRRDDAFDYGARPCERYNAGLCNGFCERDDGGEFARDRSPWCESFVECGRA